MPPSHKPRPLLVNVRHIFLKDATPSSRRSYHTDGRSDVSDTFGVRWSVDDDE